VRLAAYDQRLVKAAGSLGIAPYNLSHRVEEG
jgi:hypothetical protein